MASQQEGEGGGVGGGRGESGPAAQAASSSELTADTRPLGPWHPPDPRRQRLLADRLSSPLSRSRRPATAAPSSPPLTRHRHPLSSSPYLSQRAASSMSRLSSSAASSPRRPLTGSVSPRRQPPLFQTPVSSRKVSEDELDDIVGRVTRPTVASRGGVDLEGKDFTYIPTPRLKTLPVVPGLERRYLGLQKVSSDQLDQIVFRLTRVTSASKAKAAPNGNVYVDMAPGAHMVARARSAQPAL